MATLIVIAIVLLSIYVLPIVVSVLIPKQLANRADRIREFASEYFSTHSPINTVSLSEVGLVYKPILLVWLFSALIFGSILMLLELGTKERISSTGSLHPLGINLGILPPLFLEFSLTVSTIAIAVWWVKLRTKHVRNAATYAMALWIISRCVWFLPHPFSISNLTQINTVLTDPFGNQALVFSVATIACISGVLAIISALLDWNTKIQWALLAFTAPFVSMFWILEQTSFALLFWDITYPAMILGAAIWASRQTTRLYPDIEGLAGQAVNNSTGLFLTVFVLFSSSLILLIRIFAYPQDHTSWLNSIVVPWLSILCVSALVHIFARWYLKLEDASPWTGTVFLLCVAIAYFPGNGAWYPASVNDNLLVYFPMDWHVVGIGLLGFVALTISLYFGKWRIARPYMVGLCWPAVFQATVSKPVETYQLQGLGVTDWVAPTLALVAVFAMMAGMFGPGKLRA